MKSISGVGDSTGSDILNGLVTPETGIFAPGPGDATQPGSDALDPGESTLYDRIVDREGETNCA